MLQLVLLLVLIPFGIGLLVPSKRVVFSSSIVGATVTWALLARYSYHRPLPLNEPEWWGGLGIVYALAGLGVIVGLFIRRRRPRSIAE